MLSDIYKEKLVIESALLSKESLAEVVRLEPADFYSNDYQKIMLAIQNLYNRSEEVGLISVRDELMKLNTNGLYKQFESEFLDSYNSIGHEVSYTVSQIKMLSQKRKIWITCTDCSGDIQKPAISVEDVCINLQKTMGEVLVSDEQNDWEAEMNQEYIETYLENLNNMIIGFFGGDLITLAAGTSQGKTTLAMNLTQKIAMEHPVLFFSLEMPFYQLYQRILSTDLGIPINRLRKNELSFDEQKKIGEYKKKTKEKYHNLHVFSSKRFLHTIVNEIKAFYIKNGKIGLVVVDYLQLIRLLQKIESKRLQVDEITGTLKALAVELEVPILLISQLSRIPEGEEPKLYHLKESGGIENDSDVVLFIYNDNIIVAKQRQGPKGKVAIRYDKEHYMFVDRYL